MAKIDLYATQSYSFVLASGVKCTVGPLMGKHQKILSQRNSSTATDEVIADVVKELGSLKSISSEYAKEMLSEDRKQILFYARQLSLNHPSTFEVEIVDSDGTDKPSKSIVSIDLTDINVRPYAQTFEEYDDVLENKSVLFKIDGFEPNIRFQMLDGVAEGRLSKVKRSELSVLTGIQARNPCYIDEETGTAIKLDLERITMSMVEQIRKKIKESEGLFDLTFVVSSPFSDKEFTVNILQEVGFLVPSRVLN